MLFRSGVNGDTGEYESCIPADLTVAMGAVKPAHLVNWAGEYMKELALGEIGAHPRVEDAFSGWQEALELCHVRRFLPRRSHTGHKGQNGRLLLIAGCRQYLGAAATVKRPMTITAANNVDKNFFINPLLLHAMHKHV